jgi:hypothetical protein
MSKVLDSPDLSINTKSPFYEPNLDEFLRDEDRQFFELYTGLTGNELHEHLHQTVYLIFSPPLLYN